MKSSISNSTINEYANSMFRFERLHDSWIEKCSTYLQEIFGGEIKGKVVIDYAFGRGNWSLAFLRAGAKEVIALDASQDNVARFKKHCSDNNIKHITIEQANIAIAPVTYTGDILWFYGILHHLEDVTHFINQAKQLARDEDTIWYMYYYNRPSLRALIVDFCRKNILYATEREWSKDQILFSRQAQLRARDDLTAPVVKFASVDEFAQLLSNAGIYPYQLDNDFHSFIHKRSNEEFFPIQFKCKLKRPNHQPLFQREVPYTTEFEILRHLLNGVAVLAQERGDLYQLSIGLFNTHFSALKANGDAKESIIEVFLYLLIYWRGRTSAQHRLPKEILDYEELFTLAATSSTKEEKQAFAAKLHNNCIVEYLINNAVRM